MEEQKVDWLEIESKELDMQNPMPERLESLKLEENKIYDINIDISKPFESWKDPISGVTKKIMPVFHEGIKKNFWISIKNPTYRDIINALKLGQTKFKIMRTGQAKATRYMLVK